MRWKIETYHKILKSGCKAEDSKLRTAERLVNLIAMFCILSWRIFWLTMLNRAAPNASPRMALTKLEIQLLDKLIADNRSQNKHGSLSSYLVRLARLGGYLARATDPPPGNTVIWRGMSRLTDIEIGFQLGAQHVVRESLAGKRQKHGAPRLTRYPSLPWPVLSRGTSIVVHPFTRQTVRASAPDTVCAARAVRRRAVFPAS